MRGWGEVTDVSKKRGSHSNGVDSSIGYFIEVPEKGITVVLLPLRLFSVFALPRSAFSSFFYSLFSILLSSSMTRNCLLTQSE